MGAYKESLIVDELDTNNEASQSHNEMNLLTLIPCGFPSPAAEYIENNLNLHDHLVKRPAATFFMRATGDSMTGLGIYPDDILVIDRSIKPRSGHVVVAAVNGEYTLKTLKIHEGKPYLMPANSNYKPIIIQNMEQLQIFGVLTHNIHKHI